MTSYVWHKNVQFYIESEYLSDCASVGNATMVKRPALFDGTVSRESLIEDDIQFHWQSNLCSNIDLLTNEKLAHYPMSNDSSKNNKSGKTTSTSTSDNSMSTHAYIHDSSHSVRYPSNETYSPVSSSYPSIAANISPPTIFSSYKQNLTPNECQPESVRFPLSFYIIAKQTHIKI